MDIQMPVMDGIQATKDIRRLEKQNAPSYLSSVIIIALSASSLQSDRVAALEAGCNDFMKNPISLSSLNNKLIEWGSIKALQIWAEPFATGQVQQAKNIAERLPTPKVWCLRTTSFTNI